MGRPTCQQRQLNTGTLRGAFLFAERRGNGGFNCRHYTVEYKDGIADIKPKAMKSGISNTRARTNARITIREQELFDICERICYTNGEQ